jgi:hypothetical protein
MCNPRVIMCPHKTSSHLQYRATKDHDIQQQSTRMSLSCTCANTHTHKSDQHRACRDSLKKMKVLSLVIKTFLVFLLSFSAYLRRMACLSCECARVAHAHGFIS